MQTPLHNVLDQTLSDATQAGMLPGVVALLSGADETQYIHASGVRSTDTRTPMTQDTVFWLASMSKLVTSVAALQLVEQGRLNLTEPASRWFAELENVQVLEGFDADGQPRLRPPARPVTLHHLLTHTAGYIYDAFSADLLRFQREILKQNSDMPLVLSGRNVLFQYPLMFDPGTRWHYGINTDVVGKIVENVSGQRLGDYMRQHLFEPLGMHDTAFKLNESMHARRASIHNRLESGALQAIPMLIEQNPEFEMGGAGLYGTAQDYAQLLRLILNRGVHQGKRLLQEDTVALMLRNAIGDLRVSALLMDPAQLAPNQNNVVEVYPGIEKTWSLTGTINETPLPSGRPAKCMAWEGMANTYFWVDPHNNIAGVFMTQVLPNSDPVVLQTLESFETHIYRALASKA